MHKNMRFMNFMIKFNLKSIEHASKYAKVPKLEILRGKMYLDCMT